MKANNYKEIFNPDSGALLEIRVFETTPKDWQILLDFVSSHYEVSYTEDGQRKPLPKFDAINKTSKLAGVYLQIDLSEIKVNCHFFGNGQIEIDVLPEHVNTPEKDSRCLNSWLL